MERRRKGEIKDRFSRDSLALSSPPPTPPHLFLHIVNEFSKSVEMY